MKKRIIYLFLLSIFVSGCISEFTPNIPSEVSEMLIVEGNIVANSESTFYLSRSIPLNAQQDSDILDVRATLQVVGDDGYLSDIATYLGKGRYSVNVGNLNSGQKYWLYIMYNSNTYLSEPSSPLITPEIDSVSWVQPEKKGDVSIRVSTHDDTNSKGYYKWSYLEDWEIRSIFNTRVFYDFKNKILYESKINPGLYCWKTSNLNQVLIASSESLTENTIKNKILYNINAKDDRFSYLYSVLITQQALSRSGFEYFQNKKKLTEDMGGIFTPQPSQLKGNVYCKTQPEKKVIGYIEVLKNVSQQRLYIDPNDISLIYPAPHILDGPLLEDFEAGRITMDDLYIVGYRPQGGSLSLIEFWVKDCCINCLAAGGTKNKPYFWPNDHL